MSNSHTNASDGGRDFSCSYCERTFRRLEHLQRHTRRHTNEKPFSCHCGASFSRRDLLRRHERVARHSERPNHSHVRVSNGAERSPLGSCHPSRVAADDTLIHGSPIHHGYVSHRSPHALSLSTYLDPSFPTPSTRSDNHSAHPSTEQGPQRGVESPSLLRFDSRSATHLTRGHDHWEPQDQPPFIRDTTSGPFLQECPTIFPSPQLSLATQIIPHFSCPTVTRSDRSRLLFALEAIQNTLSTPSLPSANALTRYLAGYFTGFYPHFPFTHAPTFKLESCSPQLCLAMMAVGAQDRFETVPARELFNLSKTLLSEKQHNRTRLDGGQSQPSNNNTRRSHLLDDVRCLLCLAQFVTWQSDESLKTEACILQSLLAQSLRLSGLEENIDTLVYSDWEQWVRWESARRTKLFAFCFLATQSIAYDTPPSIWCDEVKLRLPCSCPEWTAPDSVTWSLLQQNTPHEQGLFHDTLDALLAPNYPSDHNGSSPVANYVLIHGMLQKIIWTRRSIPGGPSRDSSKDYEDVFDAALRRWTSCWQQTPESNLEPLDPNGPLPFTSCALLSLAYVRNCSSVIGSRNILTWAPTDIADALQTCLSADRRQSSLFAAYHATNLLSTLVNLGIQYFKHNQTVLWGIESTLCGLDSCVFLQKWLAVVLDTMEDTPLTDHETSLVEWIREVVHEGLSSLGDSSSDKTVSLSLLPDQITAIWSQIMQGNSPFPFVKMIGEVLVAYRQMGKVQ